MAGHVFISHGSENRDEASDLVAFIELHGVKAWIAPRDVRPGIDYSEALQAAIEGCTAFVVLVTDMANKSPYVRAETEMAFSNSKPIFPVRIADIKPAAGPRLLPQDPPLDRRLRQGARREPRPAGARAADAERPGRRPAPRRRRPSPSRHRRRRPPPPAPPPPAPAPAAAAAGPRRAAAAAAPPPPPPADAERLAAAIGPNAPWYLERWRQMDARRSQIQWNWAACLANLFWFAYRKMWVPVAALALVHRPARRARPAVARRWRSRAGVLSIAAAFATGALGTSFYRQHVGKLVAGTAGLDREAALAQLRARGGVSWQAVLDRRSRSPRPSPPRPWRSCCCAAATSARSATIPASRRDLRAGQRPQRRQHGHGLRHDRDHRHAGPPAPRPASARSRRSSTTPPPTGSTSCATSSRKACRCWSRSSSRPSRRRRPRSDRAEKAA